MDEKLFEKVYVNIFNLGFETIVNSDYVEKQILEAIQPLKEKYNENNLVGAFILGLEHGLEKRKEIEKLVGNRIEDLKRVSNQKKDTDKSLGR